MLSGELETPRLLLRPFRGSDLDALAGLYSDDETMRFIGGVRTRQQARDELQNLIAGYDLHGWGPRAITLDGTVIGRAGLWLQLVEGAREIELAYMIGRPWWRHGYGSEAALCFRDAAFGQLFLERLVSLIDADNLASVAIAQRNGMGYERDVIWNLQTMQLYSMTRNDWVSDPPCQRDGGQRDSR